MNINCSENEMPAATNTFAIGAVSCFADSFVVAESAVLQMNICAENPAHRKSANRQAVNKLLFSLKFFQ